jgi:predicted phosphate transport protein (TIGR00153 family)
MRLGILKKDLDIGKQIHDFTEQVSEGAMLCKGGVDAYLKGNIEALRASITCITDTERQADKLRRALEQHIDLETMIPESRSEVMQLVEGIDLFLSHFKGLVSQLEIESPVFGDGLHADFRKLLEYAVEAVEADVRSCRSFFCNIHAFADDIHKVAFWKREAQEASIRFQRRIFSQEGLTLSQKMHLRSFSRQIDRIAEDAEAVADRLNICVGKRSLRGRP